MVLALTVRSAGCAIGNTLGFIAKQGFCYVGLPGVRKELEETISEIAEKRFGWFIGRAIGSQGALLTSIPVTIFLGDLIWSTISQITQASVYIAARAFGVIEKTYQSLPRWVVFALKITSVVAGYFIKCTFAHYAMPSIKAGIEYTIRTGWIGTIPNPIIRTCLNSLAPFGALMIAPTATFVAADMIGSLAQSIIYEGAHTVATILFNVCENTEKLSN